MDDLTAAQAVCSQNGNKEEEEENNFCRKYFFDFFLTNEINTYFLNWMIVLA